MAKKKPAKKKPAKMIKVTDAEYLQVLINATERAISDQGNDVDKFFTDQAVRLKKRLKDLRASK